MDNTQLAMGKLDLDKCLGKDLGEAKLRLYVLSRGARGGYNTQPGTSYTRNHEWCKNTQTSRVD